MMILTCKVEKKIIRLERMKKEHGLKRGERKKKKKYKPTLLKLRKNNHVYVVKLMLREVMCLLY